MFMSFDGQKSQIVNFAVILAIMADLLFPKTVTAGAATPDFSIAERKDASREVLDETTGQIARLPRAGDIEPKRVIYVTVTAYSSTPDQTDDSPFVTASGTWVHEGTLAANFLSFGTRVRLPDHFGGRIFVVEDRMHPRFSNRADVWMETREAAKQFGIRRLKMEIF